MLPNFSQRGGVHVGVFNYIQLKVGHSFSTGRKVGTIAAWLNVRDPFVQVAVQPAAVNTAVVTQFEGLHWDKMGASSTTHVYNASSCEIEVICPVGKLELRDVQTDAVTEASGSKAQGLMGRITKLTHKTFVRDDRICSLRLPPHDCGSIKGNGHLFITVILNPDSTPKELCVNFPVPIYRSIIVTEDTVKFKGCGRDDWVDEFGKNHEPDVNN
ncbi:hypothetical protein SRHO_G00267640 [Serrasalmus rhombeus]